MSQEMPHELSENQPPVWQGKPQVPSPEPSPQTLVPPRQAQTLDFGGMLSRIWELLRADWRKHFSSAFVIAAGFSVLAIVSVTFGVQNLSDEAWAVLNGETFEVSQEPTTAEINALIGVLLEVFSLVGWLLPALLFAQLLITAVSTQRAMNHSLYEAKIENIPWVKLVTANIALTLILILIFSPMLVAFITNQVSLGVLLLLIALAFSVWFGIGVILITPVVIDQKIGGMSAVRATLRVAKGRRLMIVGISLVIGIVGSLLASTLTQLVSLVPTSSEALWYFVVSNFIPLALSLPLSAIAATVLYMNYKSRD